LAKPLKLLSDHYWLIFICVVAPALLANAIRTACETAIAAEPQLTKWDMVMGDGDCGEAVRDVSKAILGLLEKDRIAVRGSIFDVLFAIIDAVDDMGGTLGAIFGILLSAFASALRSSPSPRNGLDSKLYATALASAVESLKNHTSAREGDRTVMDVLLPFTAAFAASGEFPAAVVVAGEKAEATRYLKAKFGRATYVAEAQGQELPDPGAWAFFEIVKGMQAGVDASK
jgi:triose/dihydroxyacetone kinase / FAD-AMP lyase (cyclizing)